MNIHLVTGWGFSPEVLCPLARLGKHATSVTLHGFSYNPANLPEQAGASWVLAGWSLGGIQALDAVARKSCSPRRLVVISASARFCSTVDYPFGVSRAALRAMMAGLRRNRDETLAGFYRDCTAAPEADEAVVLAARKQSAEISTPDLQAGLTALDELDVRAQLKQITIPVLLLHGKHDRIIPVEAAQYLAEHLASARLVVHPDAGHDLPLRYPAWVAGQMQSFMC